MLIETTYFYSPPDSFSKGKVFLAEDEAHHLVDVIRARDGDEFFLTNGIGDLFRCRLIKKHRKGALAEIVEIMEPVQKPSVKICLGMSIIKPKLMELALDWSVQIGIDEFAPLITKYSQGEFYRNDNNFTRLEKIAVRAMKQSKRTWIPTIYPPMRLEKFLQQYGQNFDGIIYADYDGVPSPPKRMTQDDSNILALVGCEGGFSTAEKSELAEYDAVPVALGPARLRAETAAVIFTAKILVWTGNI